MCIPLALDSLLDDFCLAEKSICSNNAGEANNAPIYWFTRIYDPDQS